MPEPEKKEEKTEVEQFLEELETTTPPLPKEEAAPTEPAVVPPEGVAPPPPTEPSVQVSLEDENKQLKLELEKLRKPVEATPAAPPQQPAQPREPEVEMIEALGVRIPKDPTKRAIRITTEDLVKLGWNDDVAGAINVMGNVLWAVISEGLVAPSMQQVQFNIQREKTRNDLMSQFWTDHPDLKGQDDLLQMEEVKLRNNDKLHEGVKSTEDASNYMKKVGEAARRRIAGWRGISYEDYVASVSTSTGPPPTTTRGRAVTTGSSARAPVTQPDALQSELQDAAKDAVRR